LYRCGGPATSVNEETVEEVNKHVMSDRRLSVCYIATSVGISTGSVHSILTDNLLMKKVSARWVPGMLTDPQKANRVDASTQAPEPWPTQIFDRVGRPCIWPTRNFSTCSKEHFGKV